MKAMTFTPLPDWALVVGLAAHLAGGLGLGVLYFGSLWWNARMLAGSGRLGTVMAFTVARFTLLGGILTLVSLEGAMPLLMTMLGVLVARSAVLRRAREVAS